MRNVIFSHEIKWQTYWKEDEIVLGLKAFDEVVIKWIV